MSLKPPSSSQNRKHQENSGQKHAQSTFKFEGGHRQLRLSGHLLPSTTSSGNATQHVVPIPFKYAQPFAFSLRPVSNFVVLLFNHEIQKHTAKSATRKKQKTNKNKKRKKKLMEETCSFQDLKRVTTTSWALRKMSKNLSLFFVSVTNRYPVIMQFEYKRGK